MSGKGPVEEGDHLGAHTFAAGIEGGGGGTGGDTVCHGPDDGIIVEAPLRHIREGIFPGPAAPAADGAGSIVSQGIAVTVPEAVAAAGAGVGGEAAFRAGGLGDGAS